MRFRANQPHAFPNGAIGWAPGGPFDCVGPYAKVNNCPIAGVPGYRTTAYATGYADTFFSVPARTRIRGVHVGGFFTSSDNGPVFNPYDRFMHLFNELPKAGRPTQKK